MSFEDEKDGGRRRKSEAVTDSDASPRPKPRRKRPAAVETPEVGQALRSAYERTVAEVIPPEMLDLLDRLG